MLWCREGTRQKHIQGGASQMVHYHIWTNVFSDLFFTRV